MYSLEVQVYPVPQQDLVIEKQLGSCTAIYKHRFCFLLCCLKAKVVLAVYELPVEGSTCSLPEVNLTYCKDVGFHFLLVQLSVRPL